jgi:L-seryl-tRNA(Ser) seleniumtransferase
LARVVRVGKLTLAALEATLTLFLDESLALREIPTLRMLRRGLPEIAGQAEQIAQSIREGTSAAEVMVADGSSQMGSGSLPTQDLPTRLVAILPNEISPDELALRLRRWRPPIFSRIRAGQVLLDPRTLLEGEAEVLVRAVIEVLAARQR